MSVGDAVDIDLRQPLYFGADGERIEGRRCVEWIWVRICRRSWSTAVAATIERHAEELTTLDQAIGDGDHGLNMKRGFEAVLAELPTLSAKPWPDFLKGVGTTLVMKVGGASGPLYGTLFMALGKDLPAEPTRADLVRAFARRDRRRCKARGKSERGQKTMLDVLIPVAEKLEAGVRGRPARSRVAAACGRRRDHADEGDARPRLVPRRALDRPYGSRRAVVRADDRSRLQKFWRKRDGQCRHRHRLAFAQGRRRRRRHGAPDGGRGGAAGLDRRQSGRRPRHRCRPIMAAIDRAWSDAGVAILVDLGGAETNSEMAIEMLPDDRRGKVVICNAPMVEGAVMAATEAAGGSSVDMVRQTAEEYSAR